MNATPHLALEYNYATIPLEAMNVIALLDINSRHIKEVMNTAVSVIFKFHFFFFFFFFF